MADKIIVKTIKLIEKQVKGFNVPIVTKVSERSGPYQVLVSCMLSLRTKDETTAKASQRLFSVAPSTYDMVKLSPGRIEKLIYPVGFYRTKARAILETSKSIIEKFNARVPDKIEDLLTLKGVGRKTANLVLGLGYNIPAICVDTHVHRITNRLGWVRTESPQDTEEELEKIVPKRLWIDLNTILVTFGQNICVPVSPFCSKCPVYNLCKRKGVTKFR